MWSGHSCPLPLTLILILIWILISLLTHEKGCPMFRVLCETWDSTALPRLGIRSRRHSSSGAYTPFAKLRAGSVRHLVFAGWWITRRDLMIKVCVCGYLPLDRLPSFD